MRQIVILLLLSLLVQNSLQNQYPDCDSQNDMSQGKFGQSQFFNITWQETIFYGLKPTSAEQSQYPLLIFMHGSTGQWEMYEKNLQHYSSHGFIIIFPHVKGPKEDTNPLVTDMQGEHILKSLEFAKAQQNDAQSLLNGIIDFNNVIISGHSMGATATIKAAQKLPEQTIKLAISQHPGICGPIGPPPFPATWMKSDLKEVSSKFPIILTTATNDSAFWPAPYTAKFEYGCWKGGINGVSAFLEFGSDICSDDGTSKPWNNSGHNCPMKINAETPWFLTAIKLYGQQNSKKTSQCYNLLWGNDANSLRNSRNLKKYEFNGI